MQVFAFGSVPLKTYLPDGDVDITIITNANLDNNFIEDVCCLLAAEQSSDDAEFALREIQVINAKVSSPFELSNQLSAYLWEVRFLRGFGKDTF